MVTIIRQDLLGVAGAFSVSDDVAVGPIDNDFLIVYLTMCITAYLTVYLTVYLNIHHCYDRRYTCYLKQYGYNPWSYYTGDTNAGIVAEVRSVATYRSSRSMSLTVFLNDGSTDHVYFTQLRSNFHSRTHLLTHSLSFFLLHSRLNYHNRCTQIRIPLDTQFSLMR